MKIIEHRGKVEGYAAWVEILSAQGPDASFELNAGDWMYFFSKQ